MADKLIEDLTSSFPFQVNTKCFSFTDKKSSSLLLSHEQYRADKAECVDPVPILIHP